MQNESKKFLKNFLQQCGPSGFEEPAQKVWVDRTKKYAHKVTRDVMGNAIAVLNPEAKFKVMLAGHCDEIGFIITHIDDNGFLYMSTLGGIDKTTIPGSEVYIKTDKNGFVKGIIGKKAIHLETSSERGKTSAIKDLYIDIGAKNKKDVNKLGIEIGDTVTYKPNYLELNNDIISSKACDDRVGGFIISEVIRILSTKKFNIGVYAVSTVQEETGLRGATTGAYGVNPDVGIAIDVTFATDTPNSNKNQLGDIRLGKGAVLHPSPADNRILHKLLKDIAKKNKINYQIQPCGNPDGTDTAVIQLTRSGVATALISIPNRYMHTQVETVSLKDLCSAVDLIVKTILSLKSSSKFIPKV